ncbi:hypothetical protein MVLG_06519 [Microbotryum lychnidis-dioicae p1A1 Lamole]|uniref:SH3 domain-containing protein n=1 Tax=Microbotryum lychnidis-dioicae (strain p1A1 Lamole / MvSl-1064) TaxID=683840 RepID=U5HHI9_USTV1|nr:hypothetical protein MVLG_06519 [Microbotryum lychnidis-dioicae p1A1 Lamole]|eukprot:KDE02953.1 hypothetical protein MVLG_06519 [Microbotryum lychnidis-dioicae p1A1 Lamole]
MQHAQIPEAHVMKRLVKRQRADATTTRARAAATTTRRRRGTTAAADTTRSRAAAAATTEAATTSARVATTGVNAASSRSAAAVVTTRSAAAPNATKTAGTSLGSTSTASSGAAATTSPVASTGTMSHVGLIVGVAVAGIAALAVVFGLIFFYRRRRNNRSNAGASVFSNDNNHGFKKHVNDDNELFGNSAESAEKNGFAGGFGAPKNTSKLHDDGRGSWDAPSYSSHGNSNPYSNGYNAHLQQHQQPTNMGHHAPSTMNLLDDHKRVEQREMQQHLEMQQKQPEHAFAVSPQVAAAAAAAKPSANPFGGEQQGQGAVHIVKRTFEPTLSDELVLLPGDSVQLLVRYDDGWALGINLDAKGPPGKGVFPFDCLGEVTSAASQSGPQQLHTIAEGSPETSFADDSNHNKNKNNNNQHESQTNLSYGAAAPSNASSSKLAASAPQLPNLARSDSPMTFPSSQGPSTNQVPLIQISDAQNGTMSSFLDTTSTERRMSTSSLPTSLQPGGQSPEANREDGSNRSGEKGRRTSSLVASRDADLFLALGEVLDRTH